MDVNIWDRSVPVEISSYIKDDEPIFYNCDSFEADDSKLKMLDLFCGAGGFSVGCDWAGFQPVFGIDHFEPAVRTWIKNHPKSICCLGDIKKSNPEQIRDLLHSKGVDKIHLITGGVPCQGFSIANRKHNDNDERNFLFLEYMRFVEVFEPDYIILENVSGMQSTAGGKFEKDIKKAMENLGYTVTVDLVNAADYGVPQFRQRLLFVGVKKCEGFTEPYAFPDGAFVNNHRNVSDAISDLPPLANNEEKTKYLSPPKNDYQRLMRGTGKIKIKKSTVIRNHVSPNHTPETIKKIAATKQGEPMYPKFKQRIRLCGSQPSPTQLAGGIRPQFQFGHPEQPRGLSIRERARIQSFPDSYIFVGGIVQERVQTGNAVPPLLVYNIVKPIAEEIKRKDSK